MKLKNKSSFKFYSDAGHGWLAVKRNVLQDLNLLDKVSHYSYQNGATVYLEENSDMHLFLEAKKELNQQVTFVEAKHQDRMSPIRSYDSFSNKA